MSRRLVDVNLEHVGAVIGTVHDYKAQQGSPEEEAGFDKGQSTGDYDPLKRYPLAMRSLWQWAVSEGAPEWADIAMSAITEIVSCFTFAMFVNMTIAWLRITGNFLVFPVWGVLVGISAGFVVFVMSAILGHASVRLNPWTVFVEFWMPHHWGNIKNEAISKETSTMTKGAYWGWNLAVMFVLWGAQFAGYYLGTVFQNYMTKTQPPLDGTTCMDAGMPIQDESSIGTSTAMMAFWIETFGSFLIMGAWFMAFLESKGVFNSGMNRSWVYGAAHFAATVFAYSQTNAIFNPFRYLSSAIVLGTFCTGTNNTHWAAYTFGPALAAGFWCLVFLFVGRKTSSNMKFGRLE